MLIRQFILLFGSLLNLALLLCSLRSNHWINQKIPWKINGLDEDEFHPWRSSKTETSFVEVFSYSGLWKICCNQKICANQCKILHYMKRDFHHNLMISSLDVIGLLRRSCIFPILSVAFAAIATASILTSMRWWKRLLKITGGIFFVLAGFNVVMGIIIYITSNDRFWSNKGSSEISYGWSFYFACVAFLLCESLGLLAIKDVVPGKQVKKFEGHPESFYQGELTHPTNKTTCNCDTARNLKSSQSNLVGPIKELSFQTSSNSEKSLEILKMEQLEDHLCQNADGSSSYGFTFFDENKLVRKSSEFVTSPSTESENLPNQQTSLNALLARSRSEVKGSKRLPRMKSVFGSEDSAFPLLQYSFNSATSNSLSTERSFESEPLRSISQNQIKKQQLLFEMDKEVHLIGPHAARIKM